MCSSDLSREAIAEFAEPSVGISSSQRPTNKARSIASLLEDIRNRGEEGRGVATARGERKNISKQGGCVIR